MFSPLIIGLVSLDLANIQTRIQNVGGDVDITSASGEGASILAWVQRLLVQSDA